MRPNKGVLWAFHTSVLKERECENKACLEAVGLYPLNIYRRVLNRFVHTYCW